MPLNKYIVPLQRNFKATIMENKKIRMSQDTIYKYLTEHDIKITRIADLMGKSYSVIISDFRHHNSNEGKPRCFSKYNIEKLNKALVKLAEQLRSCLLTFGTDQKYTNKHGRTYDPGMIEPLNKLGEYMNLTKLICRILGWTKSKKLRVFSAPSSKNYGNISEADVTAINAEILAIIGVLEGVEVVPDDDAYDDGTSSSEVNEE